MIKSVHCSVYSTYREWTQIGYPSRHCSINQKEGETLGGPKKRGKDQLHLDGYAAVTTANPSGFFDGDNDDEVCI
jgi:hypothetical protein